MTKTLTEQWRKGTLPLGTYYILNINGDEEIDMSVAVGELWNNTDLKEVLAPVPSYEKVKEMSQKIERLEFDNEALEMVYNESVTKCNQLEKKLEIATKTLKEINKNYRFTVAQDVVYKALKEMEDVK